MNPKKGICNGQSCSLTKPNKYKNMIKIYKVEHSQGLILDYSLAKAFIYKLFCKW